MKLYKLILCLAMLIPQLSLHAQIPLNVHEESSSPSKLPTSRINDLYKISDGYWSITRVSGLMFHTPNKIKNPNYYVTKYDKNFNKTQGDYVDFIYEGKKLKLESIKKFRGQYLAFLSFENRKQKKKYLFFTAIDLDDVVASPEIKKISELKLGTKRTTEPVFDIRLSTDGKNIVVLGVPPSNLPRGKKGFIRWLFGQTVGVSSTSKKKSSSYVKFSFWVMNTSYDIINYEKNHRLQIEDAGDKFIFKDFMVDDKGVLYVLGRNKLVDKLTSSERKKKKTTNWVEYKTSAFILEQIHPDGTVAQYVTEKGVLYNDMRIIMDSKGKINLLGLVAEQLYFDLATTGIEHNVIDPETMELISQTTESLSSECLDVVNDLRKAPKSARVAKRMAKREARMNQEERERMELAKRAALKMNVIAFLDLDAEDNPILVLEEQFVDIVTTTTINSNGTASTSTDYYYHYDDIIVVRFEEGDVYQNAFKKSYLTINYSLIKPLDVNIDDEFITIAAQNMVIRTDKEVSEFASHKITGKQANGKKTNFFTYRKVLDEETFVYATFRGSKVTWIKASVK